MASSHLGFVPLLALITLIWLSSGAILLGAIVPSGDVSPSYPAGNPDPWDIGTELGVGVDSSGSLLIDGTSRVLSDGATLGFSGLLGAVEVTGPGAEWVNSQNVMIGVFGNGSLHIKQGAMVRNVGGSISDVAGESEVVVEDAGSRWINTGDLYVGTGAKGSLSIRQGGFVRSHSAWIGLFTDSDGTVTVDGPGSTWEIGQFLSLSDVGSSSQANLSLTGAGSRVYLGDVAPAVGIGLPPNETSLVIANSTPGNVNLVIYNGNSLQNSGSAQIGPNLGQHGQVLVSGAGSQWTNGGSLAIGEAGSGSLALAEGGLVSALGGVDIGPLGSLSGQGTLAANTTNGGILSPGLPAIGQTLGTLTVQGAYVQTQVGKLELGLAGNISGEWDALSIEGAASLDGTLKVSLELVGGSPFTPQLGQSFELLAATGDIVGTFSSPLLPALDPGLGWLLDYAANDVTLTVIDELTADFNYDGTVDGADLLIWEDHFDTPSGSIKATGDADLDGDTDGNDFLSWQRQLGSTPMLASGSSSLSMVPEPSALGLCLLGALSLFWRRQQPYR